MSPLLAASYIRQSKKREQGSEASPATQRDRNRERIGHMGATFVGSYEDLGISAYNGDERPEFDRLIADCHAGKVNLIVVYYVSRFSRLDPLDAIPIVTDLLNRGVTIVSVTEGEFRKGNLMDLIHLIMRLDAAHSESKNKSAAVRGAKNAARELGGYVSGKPPYGFGLEREVRMNAEGRPITIQALQVVEAEADVIRRVVRRVLDATEPVTIIGLSAWLNREKIPTRGATIGKQTADSVWSPRTIVRILRDPRIAGFGAEVIYSDKPTRSGRPNKRVAGYRIVRDDRGAPVEAHPRIIESDEWYTVQRKLDSSPTQAAPVGPAVPTLLTQLDILFCECSKPMKSHRSRERGFRSAYRCSRPAGAQRPGQHERDCTVSMSALDDYVARRIFALISTADEDDRDTLEILKEAARLYGIASADPAVSVRRGALAADLDDAEKSIEQLYDDRQAGGYAGTIGTKRFRAEELKLSTRIEALKAQLDELDDSISPMLPVEQWLGEPGTDPIGEGSWWHGAPLAERRGMVSLFVRRITVHKAPTDTTRPPIESRVTIDWVRPEAEAKVV